MDGCCSPGERSSDVQTRSIYHSRQASRGLMCACTVARMSCAGDRCPAAAAACSGIQLRTVHLRLLADALIGAFGQVQLLPPPPPHHTPPSPPCGPCRLRLHGATMSQVHHASEHWCTYVCRVYTCHSSPRSSPTYTPQHTASRTPGFIEITFALGQEHMFCYLDWLTTDSSQMLSMLPAQVRADHVGVGSTRTQPLHSNQLQITRAQLDNRKELGYRIPYA